MNVPLRRRTERDADALVDALLKLERDTGFLPSQDELTVAFGISRSRIREAVCELIARRVVEVRPKTGTRVTDERDWQLIDQRVVRWRLERDTDPAFPAQLATVLRLVEPQAAADTARCGDPSLLTEIEYACARRLMANTQPAYAWARHALHVAILTASDNPVLRQMTCFVASGDGSSSRHMPAPHVSDGERDVLIQLVAAIRAGDAAAARIRMTELNEWDLPLEGGSV
ncbi:FadR/GntR family transcriptional regulator [Burkholderia alba]|uniref:FadR/GntR family transcriptional regulator n=1 Tax=Burkholderia alba TaxID=2683677 RepID=UPI002B05417A|nr:FCD domain-containing protein [Burkholderia alba]